MEDKSIPQSVGESTQSPVPSPEQNALCKRLDDFYIASGIKPEIKPSNIFKGALYAMQQEWIKDNPDWMAQVAHSLREILYVFDKNSSLKKREAAIKNHGSTANIKKSLQDVGAYYNLITEIAHHNLTEAGKSPLVGGAVDKPVNITQEIFENIVSKFGRILFIVLRRQIDAHQEIEKILHENPDKVDAATVRELLGLNFDLRQFFFFKADENWLQWLWKNQFLDVIKEKAEDPMRYSYRMPELTYLENAVEKDRKGVAFIILQVPISEDNFNPETVDRFLRMIEKLSAKELPDIVRKISSENWERLMASFNQHWFEYKKIFGTLSEAKDYASILILAESALSVRSKKDDKDSKNREWHNNPFFIDDLSYAEVFENLVRIDDDHLEDALRLLVKVMGETLNFIAGEPDKKSVFAIDDKLHLYDVDVFSLKLGDTEHHSSRDNTQDLAASLKALVERSIANASEKPDDIRLIYEKFVQTLPDSQSMWRFRLFVLSLCPEVFKAEIERELFRAIESDKVAAELVTCPECEHLLQDHFSVLSESRQHEYVAKALVLFGKEWKQRGNIIFSCLLPYLDKSEKEAAEKLFGELNAQHKPEPSMGQMKGGTVVPQAPGTDDEWSKPVPEILGKLMSEWSPSALSEKSQEDDFLHPVDADGTGDRLKGAVALRSSELLAQAELFFDRERLSSHYTYSFLRGVYDLVRGGKVPEGVDLHHVILLMLGIMDSDLKDPFSKESKERSGHMWIANWQSVKYAMADVIKVALGGDEGKLSFAFRSERDAILSLVKYLLTRSTLADETEESEPSSKEMYQDTDPFSVAINSVQGRAFEALTSFVYQDGILLKNLGEEKKIEEDTKQLYEETLERGDSLALMFLFGYHMPSFYYRDISWITSLLPKIFSEEASKKDAYLAAWEGYTTNNLYQEMFHDLNIQALYKRGIALLPEDYTKRKYYRDLDEGIATHFALAFVYYEDFTVESELFKLFWSKENPKRHKEFVSFMGRHSISRDGGSAKVGAKSIALEKLKAFWDWTFENIVDPEVFDAFGFWVNPSVAVFDTVWLASQLRKTLEKSKGGLDWEHGLMTQLINLAKSAPEDTLQILRLYLLSDRSEGTKWIYVDDELLAVFKFLFENPTTKAVTEVLINDLISRFGSQYWELEKVMLPPSQSRQG